MSLANARDLAYKYDKVCLLGCDGRLVS